MLYIKTTYANQDEIEWHVEEFLSINADHVLLIQADGNELDLILDIFGNSIPHSHRLVQSWFGDIAKSIVFALW